MKITQITDIHIGGDYNGQFKVKKNFEKVVENIPSDTQLVVLTGDIADNNYEENYNYVRNVLKNTQFRYVILGGNHDNTSLLESVFGERYFENVNYVCVDGTKLAFIDSSSGLVDAYLLKNIKEKSIVFTHYPLIRVNHKFMNNFSLKNMDDVKKILVDKKVKDVFCGHFHFAYDEIGKVNIHVTPSTQCQIDSSSKDFKVSSYKPGFRVIEIENGNVTNNVVHYL